MGDLEKQDERMQVGNDYEVGEEEKEKLLQDEEEEEDVAATAAVLDFDVLCSSVALKAAQGKYWGKQQIGTGSGGGVLLRMWEGELLADDCFHHRRIALQSTFFPCYRFGKNMKRAGFGSCYIQAAVYLILATGAFLSLIAFAVTRRHCFLYMDVAFIVFVGAYLGFFRTLMRKKFNIKGSDSSFDDFVYHFACPCCTLSQESRTLEMNNVQDGTWHGRGDTVCIGGFGEKGKTQLRPPPIVSIKTVDEL